MKPFIICMMMVACLICSGSTVNADLYKWVDADGVKHFTNTPPPSAEQVESAPETKSKVSYRNNNAELDEMINSYKRDELQQSINKSKRESEKKYNSKIRKNKESSANYYEKRVKQKEETVRNYSEDLEKVKRERYSDSNRHEENVQYYESRLKQAEIDLEYYQKEYKNAKY